MSTPLPASTTTSILSAAPFICIPGIINIRDLGLLPSSPIAPGLLFRSGAIHTAAASSPDDIASLGVNMVLDLRTEGEVKRGADPVVEGVGVPSPIGNLVMSDFIEEGGVKAYTAMYLEVLEVYAPSFKRALEWLRDERSGILFHCTAGKDRTGVLAALLLSLAGASRDLIAYDYALTRVGVEPSRELLVQMLRLWNKEWTADTPGMHEFTQVKGDFILGLLDAVELKYGGMEGYVIEVLGFGVEDLGAVKSVLRGGASKSKDGSE
ncbi:Nn.00g063910.m01.CDS01 [Neocucurbitaria sp. VM-36]